MAAPIPPSLSQLIHPQVAPARPAAQPPAQAGGFATALQAQKAFFQQVTAPQGSQKITPATYTAADIAKAAPQTAPAPDENQPYKRPGSYLNIVI